MSLLSRSESSDAKASLTEFQHIPLQKVAVDVRSDQYVTRFKRDTEESKRRLQGKH